MANLQGSTQGVNFPETSEGAQAAVSWINANGGVQGHPLKLTVCDLLTTPASDQSCAASMASANPIAILGGAIDNGDPIVRAAAGASIPYANVLGTSPQEVSSPYSFIYGGSFPGNAYLVASTEKLHGGKHVVLLLPAQPGAISTVQAASAPYYAKAGITVSVVATNPAGEPDMTPIVQAASNPPTTGILVDTAEPNCIGTLQAKSTLSISSSIRFYLNASCET
jgi:branched-chain amino acid transport system substrate-binding protein